MKRNSLDEAARWIRQAREDLRAADYLVERGIYNIACFLAQQAAEKALKGYLYGQGQDVVWGHSVAELAAEAASRQPAFSDVAQVGAYLDRFYIPTRYPNGLPGGIPADSFTHQDASRALDEAQKLIDLVDQQLARAGEGAST